MLKRSHAQAANTHCVQALCSQQLSRLQDVLVHRLLPRLPLQALQSFSLSCKAARAAVLSLPEQKLLLLAQVRDPPCSAAAEQLGVC